jgi:chloramphenicol-sensitive protein RarD
MPLYFKAVENVPPWQLLAHRVLWCLLLLAVVLTVMRRWPEFFRCVRTRRTLGLLCISALLVGANWYFYILGVSTNRIVETSLGYFINPLFSILLGLVFFRERLRSWQWVAIALATAGVTYYVCALGALPWIALVLAASFGTYGLVRKVTVVDAVVGLTVETLVLVPVAALYLAWVQADGTSVFGSDPLTDALILASGVVTAVPLLCFAQAARRLPLSTLGFLQYLAPSLQLALAVLRLNERFTGPHAVCFSLIWAGLLIFTIDSLRALRNRSEPVTVEQSLAIKEDGARGAELSRLSSPQPDVCREGAQSP